MGRALIKVNPVDSHMSENLNSPYPDDKRIRLERRWRRREAMNDSLKHNHFTTSAKKTTAKACGNTAVLIDTNDHTIDDDADWLMYLSAYTGDDGGEVDEDYGSFLPTHDPDIQTDCASNHSGGSNGNNNDGDETDADYASYLNTYNLDIETDCTGNRSGGSNINNDSDEIDADYASYLATYNLDIETDCTSNCSGGLYINNDSDEMDADYASYLATYNLDIETDCASNRSGGSNINNDSDEMDADYASYLATYNLDIETDCTSNRSGGSNINNDSDEMDADYASYLATYNLDIETDCASNRSGGSNIYKDKDADYGSFLPTSDPDIETACVSNHSGGSNGNNNDSDEMDTDYASYFSTYNFDIETDCSSNHSGGSNINKDNDEVGADYGSFLPTNVPNIETYCASDHSGGSLASNVEFNEDYEQFLNSVTIVDDDKVYFYDKNTTNTSNVEAESNSSDSDLIVLESYPICGNTPFVSSKTYDSSCFGEEMNPEDNNQIAAYHHSQFRRRLMECLDRPYDQEEYDDLLLKVSKQTKKERHLETRQGVIKSYHYDGLNKSYLDTHPDLVKAIAEFKEQHRVLFLLRGFFFWLQRVSLAGRFQPWRDESCLEILRKM